MGTGFGVDPDQVVQHATDLRSSVFSKLENAAAAAKEVGIGDEVYGVILQFVIPRRWSCSSMTRAAASTRPSSSAVPSKGP